MPALSMDQKRSKKRRKGKERERLKWRRERSLREGRLEEREKEMIWLSPFCVDPLLLRPLFLGGFESSAKITKKKSLNNPKRNLKRLKKKKKQGRQTKMQPMMS